MHRHTVAGSGTIAETVLWFCVWWCVRLWITHARNSLFLRENIYAYLRYICSGSHSNFRCLVCLLLFSVVLVWPHSAVCSRQYGTWYRFCFFFAEEMRNEWLFVEIEQKCWSINGSYAHWSRFHALLFFFLRVICFVRCSEVAVYDIQHTTNGTRHTYEERILNAMKSIIRIPAQWPWCEQQSIHVKL